MPAFNFASALSSKRAGTDYGPLISQVSILEKQLAMDDGSLSSGDYDQLIKQYNTLLAKYPFTPTQRAEIETKIATYEKSKTDIVFDSFSVENINKDYKDDMTTFVRNSGNNIYQFLDGKRLALENKFAITSQRIDNIYAYQTGEEADKKSFSLRNEKTTTIQELENVYSALGAIENPTGATVEGLGVFVTTNKDGQILDIDVGSPEGKSGFGKTDDNLIITKDVAGNAINPVMTGLQVYGNEQEGIGKDKVIKIGNSRYLKSQMTLSLFGETPTYTKEVSQGEAGQGLDLASVKLKQPTVPGEWVIGINSKNLYQQKPDGKNKKYTGSLAEQKLKELESNKIYPLPIDRNDEKMYNNLSDETVTEESFMPMDYQPTSASSVAPSVPSVGATQSPQPAAGGMSTARTQAPVERAPQGIKEIAGKTLQSAIGYFKSFLNR